MREKVTNSQMVGVNSKHKSEMITTRREDQICFPFLREVLGITDTGCSVRDCPRIHDVVFKWKKADIKEALKAVSGSSDLITALATSKKFDE
jgi:hypothetical protein